MRDDMKKVATTRPRQGGYPNKACKKKAKRKFYKQNRCREKTLYYKGVTIDTRPKFESIRAQHSLYGTRKEFNEYLNPLFRYLMRQAGRKWDDVWSEICQSLNGNGTLANHVKFHVKQEVGGVPHSNDDFLFSNYFEPGRGIVWVDENGILQRTPQNWWWRRHRGLL